ncbi:hypothetical protein BDF22DRAFT_743527 [Syncephalis plumigaleata]|nr:hypothetical protein BDF22DRAFT_743527 [Syncephalis plumigaleata]
MAFTLPQLSFGLASMMNTTATLEDTAGCVAEYPYFISLYWFAITMPGNTFFSAIFCRVVYNQYRRFGSEAWRRLARDGIQKLCAAVFCNVFCGLIIITRAFDSYSDFFFVVDWVVISTILTSYYVGVSSDSIGRRALDSNKSESHIVTNINQTISTICEGSIENTSYDLVFR